MIRWGTPAWFPDQITKLTDWWKRKLCGRLGPILLMFEYDSQQVSTISPRVSFLHSQPFVRGLLASKVLLGVGSETTFHG